MQANEIATREFVVALRGYDPEEVRSYLQEVAAEFERLSNAEPPAAAATEEPTPRDRFEDFGRVTARILETVETAADEVIREAEADAERTRAAAEHDASTARAEVVKLREEADTLAASVREREDALARDREAVDATRAEAEAELHAAREKREAADARLADLEARASRLSVQLREAAQELAASAASTPDPADDVSGGNAHPDGRDTDDASFDDAAGHNRMLAS